MRRALACGSALAFALALTPTSAQAKESGPRVYFSPGGDFPRALARLLLGARERIDVALYSFQATSKRGEDDYARLLAAGEVSPLDALREAVARKVRVRVVLNHARTDPANRKTAALLLEAGAEVYAVGKTMHSKYAVIDGRTVVNGSGNWSVGAFHRYHENWVVFPKAPALAQAFERNFRLLLAEGDRLRLGAEGGLERSPRKKKAEPAREPPSAKERAQVVFTSDNRGRETTVVEDLLVRSMRSAERRIDVAVAHFNTQRLADELVAAAERGVAVRVLVDLGEYRNRVSQAARLEKAGVPVRYHVYSVKMFFPFAQLMHHKMMLVDGRVLLSGSYNWSRTAEWNNHENVQVLRSSALLKAFAAEFERLWTLRRKDYPGFLAKVRARGPKDPNYRRYLPVHFPPMALTGKEMAALRRAYVRLGFAMRPYKGKPATSEFWNLDRERRVGVNELPEGHRPFFERRGLVVSEVCHRPVRAASGEYVELYNGGEEPVDLAGYVLADGDGRDVLVRYGRRTTVLRPGRYALVIDPQFADDFELPRGVVVLTVGDKTLGNGLSEDDVVRLETADGVEVDSLPLQPTPRGQAVHRKVLAAAGTPSNLRVGPATPGRPPR